MSPAVGTNHKSVLVTARQKFRAGIVISAVPVGAQVAIAGLIVLDDTAFPKADDAFHHPAFWLMQLILICVSIGGNTIVDFSAAKSRTGLAQDKIHYMYFFFSIILVAVVMAIADKDLNWKWLVGVAISGIASLWLAFLVEMELALAEVNVGSS